MERFTTWGIGGAERIDADADDAPGSLMNSRDAERMRIVALGDRGHDVSTASPVCSQCLHRCIPRGISSRMDSQTITVPLANDPALYRSVDRDVVRRGPSG